MNIRTVINALSEAKENCYKLATEAFNKGDIDGQKRMYALADVAQTALDAALAEEQTQEKASLAEMRPSSEGWDLDNFDEVK